MNKQTRAYLERMDDLRFILRYGFDNRYAPEGYTLRCGTRPHFYYLHDSRGVPSRYIARISDATVRAAGVNGVVTGAVTEEVSILERFAAKHGRRFSIGSFRPPRNERYENNANWQVGDIEKEFAAIEELKRKRAIKEMTIKPEEATPPQQGPYARSDVVIQQEIGSDNSRQILLELNGRRLTFHTVPETPDSFIADRIYHEVDRLVTEQNNQWARNQLHYQELRMDATTTETPAWVVSPYDAALRAFTPSTNSSQLLSESSLSFLTADTAYNDILEDINF